MSLAMKHTEEDPVGLSGPFFSTAVFRFVRHFSSSTLKGIFKGRKGRERLKDAKKHPFKLINIT